LAKTVAATARTAEPGRFHITGEFGALYLALEAETALRELARRANRAGIQVRHLMPRDLLTVELRLAEVLDLNDEGVRAEWGLDVTAVTSNDFTACQEVAAAARRAGYEAIKYPSATGEGQNLALFHDRIHPGSSAVIVNAAKIDPDSVSDT
jgi:RES domain-containing protein